MCGGKAGGTGSRYNPMRRAFCRVIAVDSEAQQSVKQAREESTALEINGAAKLPTTCDCTDNECMLKTEIHQVCVSLECS